MMGKGMVMLVFAVMVAALAVTVVRAADPELLVDFQPPPGVNPADLEGDFFTFTRFRNATPDGNPNFATVIGANVASNPPFPALQGLGLSNALLIYPKGTINRPHTHPRGTETLFVLEGCLFVGLLDSTNKLRTQILYKGDIFVFPRGLIHFQINLSKETVIAYAGFSSANAGLITIPVNVFGSNPPIDVGILAKSFGVDPDVIKALLAAQGN